MANGLDTAGAGLSGALGGAALGAKIGSVVPGVGTAIGAGAGALLGAGSGMVKQKRAQDAQEIGRQDPNIARRMAELDQISRSMRIGSDALTQNKLRETQRLGAQTQGAISRVSGGDVGGTIAGLLRAQRNTQSGVNQALADRGQLPYFQNLGQQLATRMADRRLQLARLQRDQRTAEYAQARKEANLNAIGALAAQSLGDGTGDSLNLGGGDGLNVDLSKLGQGVQSLWQNAQGMLNRNRGGVGAGAGSVTPSTDPAYDTAGNVVGIQPDPYAYANQSIANRDKMVNMMQPNFLNMALVSPLGTQYMMQQQTVPSVEQEIDMENAKG